MSKIKIVYLIEKESKTKFTPWLLTIDNCFVDLLFKEEKQNLNNKLKT